MGQQRVTAQSPGEWFMIAGEGDMVLRIRHGMSVGETAEGDLTFTPARAQLTLDITDDGSLVLATVGDFELASADDAPRVRVSLARNSRADICLTHHVLRVDTDFVDPMRATGSIAVITVRSAEQVPEPRVARLRRVLAEEPGEPASDASPPREAPSDDGGRHTIVEPPVKRAEVAFGSTHRDDQRASVHRRPILTPGALVGLAVIGLALLYPALHEIYTPRVADTVQVPPVAPAEDSAAADEPSSPAIETTPPLTGLPPRPLRRIDPATAPVAEPERQAEIAQRSSEPIADPEAGTEPVIAPVVPSPRPARPAPDAVFPASEPAAQADRVENQVVDPAFLAELEHIGATARAVAAGMTRRLDLLAADLALAQGRLTHPPEASAYMLYARVLAQDPDSTEARRGVQAVRQQLINQALAQLAAGQLEQARNALQDAEDVGANPRLIADLRAEIGFRQQQIESRNDSATSG